MRTLGRFSRQPTGIRFWRPAPLLAKLAAEGKTFNDPETDHAHATPSSFRPPAGLAKLARRVQHDTRRDDGRPRRAGRPRASIGRGRRRADRLRVSGRDRSNIARQIRLPPAVPCRSGATISRFCSSGLQTMRSRRNASSPGDIVAGGVESISTCRTVEQHMLRAVARQAQARIYWPMLQTPRSSRSAYDISRGCRTKLRRAQPAACGRGGGGRQVQRRNRSDDRDHGRGRQGHGADLDPRRHDRRRRRHPRRHDLRGRRQDQARVAGRRDRGREREPILGRGCGVRGAERPRRRREGLAAARRVPRFRSCGLRARRDGHRSGVSCRSFAHSGPGSTHRRTSTCGAERALARCWSSTAATSWAFRTIASTSTVARIAVGHPLRRVGRRVSLRTR